MVHEAGQAGLMLQGEVYMNSQHSLVHLFFRLAVSLLLLRNGWTMHVASAKK